MNLTVIQKIAISMATLGVLATSGSQLTEILGTGIAKSVVSVAGLTNSVLAAIVAVLSGQGAILKQVAAIQGDDGKPAVRINVNANAPVALASAAVDPDQKNIGASTPEARQTLIATAKGG